MSGLIVVPILWWFDDGLLFTDLKMSSVRDQHWESGFTLGTSYEIRLGLNKMNDMGSLL